VAESVRRILLAIVRDENVILPLTSPVEGHYGLDNLSLCLPSVIGRSGVRRVLEIPLDNAEERHLRKVAERLKG
jgi:L-lactate dehydrogenase